MKGKNRFYFLIALPSLILTALLFVFPLAEMMRRSLTADGAFMETVTSPYTVRLFAFTLLQALASAAVSVILAFPFAFFFSSYSFPGRRLVMAISDSTFVLPSIIVVLAFVIWYGNNGILNSILSSLSGGRIKVSILYSFPAVILAHVYLNFPLAFSLLTSALLENGKKDETAAGFLGRKKAFVFFSVTLPKIRGTIKQTLLMIFLFCFPSFLIVMTIGGSPKYYTVEAEIYRRAYVDGSLSSASSLSLVSFLFLSLLTLLTGWGKRETKNRKKGGVLKRAHGKTLILAFLLSLLILLFILPPLLSVCYRAFFTRDGVFTLKAWQKILEDPAAGRKALLSSLVIALLSSLTATRMASSLAVSSAVRKSRLIPLLTSLPLLTGSVTLGLGFSLLSSLINIKGELLSFILTLLAHTAVVLPFALRTMLPGARVLTPSLLSSSLSLSHSRWKSYLKVEKPLLRRYRLKAWAFAFALSLGETNATLALGNGRVVTLPVLIYTMIQQYNYQGASALSMIVLFLSLSVFALSEQGGDRDELS